MGPSLAAFVQKNPEYAVIVVDVANWGSPVAKQFDIHSLPGFAIYGADGKMQMSGKPAREKVGELVGR